MKRRLQAWGGTTIIPIATVFLFNDADQLLLLRRHVADLGGGKWGTPGGRLEPNEDSRQAMQRELREETGIEIDSVQFERLGSHTVHMPHGVVHMASYRATVPKEVDVVLDPSEHQAFAWVGTADLLTYPNLLWGTPSILRDFGLLPTFDNDPTLQDGSFVRLVDLAR